MGFRVAEAARHLPDRVRQLLRGPRPEAVPVLVGRACALVGLLDIAAGVFPRFRHSRMHAIAEVLPGSLGPFAAALSLSAGVLLLLLAHGLKRGKRRAWRAAVALLPAGAVAQFTYRHSIVGVLISLALLAPLLRHRDQFAALPDPRSRWRALANFVLMSAGSLAARPAHRQRPPERIDRRPEPGRPHHPRPLRPVRLRGPGRLPGQHLLDGRLLPRRPRPAHRRHHHLPGLPPRTPGRAASPRRTRPGCAPCWTGTARRDSLGHFALRRDKAVVFSPSGKAAVTYRVVSGVMLASGDPIGDVEAWPGAIERFMDEAKAHSWTPAVMGCSETGGEVWTRETGLDALELGDEAVVDVADFSLAGRAMRNVRQMVKRIERAGYETRVRRVRDLGEAELERIRRAADDWRGTDTERGFSMALGRVGDPADGDCLIATAHKQDDDPGPYGDLKAILHFVPWGTDGASLDLMRRDRSADPGMNELLIVAALQAAPKFGIARVSLNFAMFRAALARGEKIGAGPVLRAWRGPAGLPLPLVPDRVPVQVQRQVPAPLGTPLRRLPRLRRPAPHRLRRHAGRGLRQPRPAPAALPAPPYGRRPPPVPPRGGGTGVRAA